MQAHAIPGPWAAGERVLVCIERGPRRRVAWCAMPRRLADRLRAPWTALYVETPRSLQLTEEAARPHRRHACASPSSSAARRSRIPGREHVADEIVRYATANNVTHIVIGKPARSRWREIAARLGRRTI